MFVYKKIRFDQEIAIDDHLKGQIKKYANCS